EDLLVLHPEVVAAVHLELVELDEAARIEEQLDSLPRGELALLVLLGDALLAASKLRLRIEGGELLARTERRQPLGALCGGHPAVEDVERRQLLQDGVDRGEVQPRIERRLTLFCRQIGGNRFPARRGEPRSRRVAADARWPWTVRVQGRAIDSGRGGGPEPQ